MTTISKVGGTSRRVCQEPEIRPPKLAYRVDEFCTAHGIGRSKFYNELKSGRLKARRIGKRIVVLADDAKSWLANLPSA